MPHLLQLIKLGYHTVRSLFPTEFGSPFPARMTFYLFYGINKIRPHYHEYYEEFLRCLRLNFNDTASRITILIKLLYNLKFSCIYSSFFKFCIVYYKLQVNLNLKYKYL